jgi:hypothetical protein
LAFGSKPPVSRRRLIQSLTLGPVATLALPGISRATEYSSAADVLSEVERLATDVKGRLQAIAKRLPSAGAFVSSAWADHARHREDRDRLRRRLGLPPAEPALVPESADRSLEGLRSAQQALVFAHAEGLPALRESAAVATMARNMVDLARHLTIIDLWIELESSRE